MFLEHVRTLELMDLFFQLIIMRPELGNHPLFCSRPEKGPSSVPRGTPSSGSGGHGLLYQRPRHERGQRGAKERESLGGEGWESCPAICFTKLSIAIALMTMRVEADQVLI